MSDDIRWASGAYDLFKSLFCLREFPEAYQVFYLANLVGNSLRRFLGRL
jgi:hypothetical protein